MKKDISKLCAKQYSNEELLSMISKKIVEALNGQLNAELYSSYLYLSMSAYFESTIFKGFAHWMKCQSEEENIHTSKIYDFIIAQGARVNLTAIEKPISEWKTPLAVFKAGLNHEKKVTGLINTLIDKLTGEKDYATNNLLQWFTTEQVEEEDSFSEIVKTLTPIENDVDEIIKVDNQLSKRS